LTLDVSGDLTIRHVTRSETFRVVVQVVAADRLEGEAATVISRAEYELSIPSVEGVAEVGDEVELSLSFRALAGR
jgi:polyisoprenoid-binding protein YceI